MSININQLAQQEITSSKMLRLKEDKLEIVEKTTWRRFKAFIGCNSYNLKKITNKIIDTEINIDGTILLNRNLYKNMIELNFILEKFNDKNKQSININLLRDKIITDINLSNILTIENQSKLKSKSIDIIKQIFNNKFVVDENLVILKVNKTKLLEIVEDKISDLLDIRHEQKRAFIDTAQKEYRPRQWEVYRVRLFHTIETRLKGAEGKHILNVSVSSFAKEKTVSQVEDEALQIFTNLCKKAAIDSQQSTLVTDLAKDSILLDQGQLAFNYVHLVAILADVDSKLTIPTKDGPQPLKTILVNLIEHFADHGTSTSPKAAEKLYTKLNAIYFDLKNHQYS